MVNKRKKFVFVLNIYMYIFIFPSRNQYFSDLLYLSRNKGRVCYSYQENSWRGVYSTKILFLRRKNTPVDVVFWVISLNLKEMRMILLAFTKSEGWFWRGLVPKGFLMQRADRAMIRWICGMRLRDEIPTVDLLATLGLEEITSAMRTRRPCC